MAIEIGTVEELIAFGNGDYGRGSGSGNIEAVLTADLDFADLTEYDIAYNWVGCRGDWYINFDGQGHTIDNINYVGTWNWGFFGTLHSTSEVKNLNLTNMYVIGTGVGGIAQYCAGTTIQNCKVSGMLQGTADVGGIIGNAGNPTSTVRECSVSGKLTSTSSSTRAGGICPTDSYTQVFNSIVVADISSNNYTTGIKGSGNTAINCEVRGTLKGASGRVGLFTFENATSVNCIAAVTSLRGGWYNASYNNCYMDSTLASAGGFSIPSGVTGATTEELKDESWLRSHNFAI